MAETEQAVSLTAAAQIVGRHKSTISRQLRDGIIPNRGTADRPMVLVSEVRAARAAQLDLAQQRGAPAAMSEPAPATAATGPTFNQMRTAREGYQARLAQLDLQKRLGALLDKGLVVDAFFALGQALREGADERRANLAARLVGIADPNRIAALLDESDRDLFETLSNRFERRLLADAAAATDDAAA